VKNIENIMMASWIGNLTFDEDKIDETLKEINSQVPIEKKDEAQNIILRLINKIREKFQRKERDKK